jgi:iron(III) transport system permease protein
MLVVVAALLFLEQWARRRQRFHVPRATTMRMAPPRVRITGARGAVTAALVSLPVLFGFGIPAVVFGQYAIRRLDQLPSPRLAEAFLTSLTTATATALITVALALFLLDAVRLTRSRAVTATVRLASVGYALPGGILGLGLLFVLARFDNTLDAFLRATLGVSSGLLLTGSAAAVIIACSIRFVALAEGAIRSGLEKLPGNLDEAARSLGKTPAQSARVVLLPLLRPAMFTASVLVFVDTIKELSATILLRPFGFSTLATLVYESASRGAPEEGAGAALLIILTALAPVLLLSRALACDRETSS